MLSWLAGNSAHEEAAKQAHEQGVKQAENITVDYQFLAAPFMPYGYIVTCMSTGRRYHVHHASEIPRNRVYRSNQGTRIEHVDEHTLLLNDSIRVTMQPPPPNLRLCSSVSRTEQMPLELFEIDCRCKRYELVREMWQQGRAASKAGDPSTACEIFGAAYALSAWPELMVWLALIRFELSDLHSGKSMCRYALRHGHLQPSYRLVAEKMMEACERGCSHPHQGVTLAVQNQPIDTAAMGLHDKRLPDVELEQPLAHAKPEQPLADGEPEQLLTDAKPKQLIADANRYPRQPLADAKPKQLLSDADDGRRERVGPSTRAGVDADLQRSSDQLLTDVEEGGERWEADSSPRGFTRIPASSKTATGSVTVVRRRRRCAGGDAGENDGVEAAQ